MTNGPTRVLVVHMSLYNGGAERSLINFLSALPADSFAVDLLLFRTEGAFLPQLPAHVRLLETPEPLRTLYYNENSVLPQAKGARGLLLRAFRLGAGAASAVLARGKANLRRQKRWRLFFRHVIPRLPGVYDTAVAYFHGEVSYYVMDKVTAKRKLAWVHNDYDRVGQSPAIDGLYFQRFDKVVSVSALCVDALRRRFPELQDKFIELPNLTQARTVRALSRELDPPEYAPELPAVLSVGRLNPQKACELSVEAAAMLKARGVAFTWYWLGDGDLRDEIARLIAEKQVGDRFVLLGPRPNPYPYMRCCDVFVQNSRYEGKSMVLDEAKILARPIVVTAYPTVADQIEKDVEGLVVPFSAEAVAEGVARMLADAALRERFSRTLSSREYDNMDSIARYKALLTGADDISTRLW